MNDIRISDIHSTEFVCRSLWYKFQKVHCCGNSQPTAPEYAGQGQFTVIKGSDRKDISLSQYQEGSDIFLLVTQL